MIDYDTVYLFINGLSIVCILAFIITKTLQTLQNRICHVYLLYRSWISSLLIQTNLTPPTQQRLLLRQQRVPEAQCRTLVMGFLQNLRV